MSKGATKFRVAVTAIVTAMALAACGGGGGGGGGGTPPGGAAPGGGLGTGGGTPVQALSWTQQTSAPAQPYHTVSVSSGGQVMLAAGNSGQVYMSSGGDNWVAQTDLPTARWVASDMDATGSTIFVAAFDGRLYRLRTGETWTAVDASFNPEVLRNGQLVRELAYESIGVSANGQRVLVAIQGQTLQFSNTGGDSWAPVTMPAGTSNQWRAADLSADGTTAVAANHDGQLFVGTVSAAGVATFTQMTVTDNAGAPVTDSWYRAAISGDGNTIVAVGTAGWGPMVTTGIYIGRRAADGTWTWSQGSTVAGHFGGVAISADGRVIAASLYEDARIATAVAPGQILVSVDNGRSFTQARMPNDSERNYRTIAMTGAADRLLVGAGEFAQNGFAGVTGNLYVSSGTIGQ